MSLFKKALLKKHTQLIMFMASKVYLSQKEIIRFALDNKEFKDKDSWENKGQFKDKLVSLGLIEKISQEQLYSELSDYPEIIDAAAAAYTGPKENRQAFIAFRTLSLLSIFLKEKGASLLQTPQETSFRRFQQIYRSLPEDRLSVMESRLIAANMEKRANDNKRFIFMGHLDNPGLPFSLNLLANPFRRYAALLHDDLYLSISSFINGCASQRLLFFKKEGLIEELLSIIRPLEVNEIDTILSEKARGLLEEELKSYLEFKEIEARHPGL